MLEGKAVNVKCEINRLYDIFYSECRLLFNMTSLLLRMTSSI